MELLMLFIALFVFFFGSVIALQVMEYGLRVGDKSLEAFGGLAKLPFKVALNLIRYSYKHFIKRMMKDKPQEITIKPIFAVTPLELQHMRNKNLIQSGKRQPVLIEHPPQQTK
jgi:hypothetical protein